MKYFFSLFLSLLSLKVNSRIVYTVSGFNTGGYMAVQQHVSFSSLISGAGIVAGGPYYCTMGSQVRAQSACTINPWLIDVSISIAQAIQSAESNLIDPLSNLASDTVYLFSGSQDLKVSTLASEKLEAFYSAFITTGKINTTYSINVNHAWVTQSTGNPCYYYGLPFINACGFDLSQAILYNLYGNLAPQSLAFNNSNLFEFDQSAYANVWQAGLSTRGWVYAPYNCRQNPILCKTHVNFHGCLQNYDTVGTVYMQEMGLGQWAETNSIIVVFPQISAGLQRNPFSCWDAAGYTGSDFYLKTGLQIAAVNNIVQNITSIVQSFT